jgi:glycerol-3-phosphate dehydrogenase (NAD(P)+)
MTHRWGSRGIPGVVATICVLGAGMMGSALCVPLVDRGHEVRLVGTHLDRDIIRSLRDSGVHPKLGLALPGAIRAFQPEELEQAADGADAIALGVSSAGVRWAGERIAPLVRPETNVVMVSKGLDWDGRALVALPDVLDACLPAPVRPAAVTGPCIAGELARRVETSVVLAGRDAGKLRWLADRMRTPYYHVRTSNDLVGAEACAALKNAYAMGIGLAAGLHEAAGGKPGPVAMHNYEAAVFAQAILEMGKLVAVLGGQPASVHGLPGVGDLNVTCNGGRTGRFGRWLGLGLGLDEAIARMQGATLECLEILSVLRAALPSLEARGAVRRGELPLLDHLIQVGLQGARPGMPFERFFGGEPVGAEAP